MKTPKSKTEICATCGHDKAFHEIDKSGCCVYGLSIHEDGIISNKGCSCKKFIAQNHTEPELDYWYDKYKEQSLAFDNFVKKLKILKLFNAKGEFVTDKIVEQLAKEFKGGVGE